MDKLISEIYRSNTIKDGMHIIVGFSGGPDSLALLHALVQISEGMHLRIVPVHINHRLRGERADEEQRRAEEFCRSLGLECISRAVDCRALASNMKISVETAGRFARYSQFMDIAADERRRIAEESGRAATDERRTANPDKVVVAVAQNADDQSETVLFRALRGTGIAGLAGMSHIRKDEGGSDIIRPLLKVTRREIEGYIERNGLSPNMDDSNADTEYTRNKIRLELIPYIEKNINENARENLRRLSYIASAENDFIEREAAKAYGSATARVGSEAADEDEVVFDSAKLRELHPAVLRRVIAKSLGLFVISDNISYRTIEDVIALVHSDDPSARIDLPQGCTAERRYGETIIRRPKKDGEKHSVTLEVSVISPEEAEAAEVKNASDFAVFDFDKIKAVHGEAAGDIVLRHRKEGDRIAIGEGKYKKLQDVFVDDKVPRFVRDDVYVAACGSEVLWILPNENLASERHRKRGKFSQNYHVENNSERLLFLEMHRSVW